MKGMILDILRPADGHDLTLRGLSSRATRAYLIGDGVPEVFEVKDDLPVLLVDWRRNTGYGPRLVPASHFEMAPDGSVTRRSTALWHMFGGNFGYSSDSRISKLCRQNGWAYGAPIPIHDRVES